jgi:LytS/YehU family sensor histidine kinase
MLALVGGLAAALAVHSWDGKALLMFVVGLTLATAWVARAAWLRERGSTPALIGLVVALVTLLWLPFQFADVTLYLALDFLLACLLVAHALQVRRFRQEREEALIKSARLEAELLRRHIQPHFLMNTLTALSEWIEEEPAVAVSMIEAISEEFRILARISNRTLIELGEELDLCRTHIEIMSRRRGRAYVLRVDGVDTHDLVPPAIFHTLVENAITHDDSGQKLVELTLSATANGAGVRYDFAAPYSGSGAGATEGTGLRYIRARLDESFGRDWALESGPADGEWRTSLSIPRRR